MPAYVKALYGFGGEYEETDDIEDETGDQVTENSIENPENHSKANSGENSEDHIEASSDENLEDKGNKTEDNDLENNRD